MEQATMQDTIPQDVKETLERMVQERKDNFIVESKQLRVEIDAIIQKIKSSTRTSRERSLSITKLQEAVMWLGMDLKDLGDENPYPNSYNPENTIVDPTADGLKL